MVIVIKCQMKTQTSIATTTTAAAATKQVARAFTCKSGGWYFDEFT